MASLSILKKSCCSVRITADRKINLVLPGLMRQSSFSTLQIELSGSIILATSKAGETTLRVRVTFAKQISEGTEMFLQMRNLTLNLGLFE